MQPYCVAQEAETTELAGLEGHGSIAFRPVKAQQDFFFPFFFFFWFRFYKREEIQNTFLLVNDLG